MADFALPPSAPATELPTISGPGINPDEMKLQDIQDDAANKSVGLETAAKAVAPVGTDIAATFQQMSEDQKAAAFQKILSGGWDTYTKAWQAAGSPPSADPSILKTGDPKTDLGADGMLITGYKMITNYKGQHDVAAAAKAPGATATSISAAGAESGVIPPEDVVKAQQDKEDKDEANTTKLEGIKETHDARIYAANVRLKVANYQGKVKTLLGGIKDAANLASMKDKAAQLDNIQNQIQDYEKTDPVTNRDNIKSLEGQANRLWYNINNSVKAMNTSTGITKGDSTAHAQAPPIVPKTSDTGGLTKNSSDADITAALKQFGRDTSPASIKAVRDKLDS